jgi:hypothetical protein
MVAILITRCAFSPSSSPRSSAVVAAMALLDPPERLQSEVALNLVRNLLGWGAPAFAERICVGASPHGDLTTGEFVLFVSNLPSGLALAIPSFFVLLLESLASNLSTSRPASSFRRPSSPTSARCPWGRHFFPLLPPAFGGNDVHQPYEGGQWAELRLHALRPQLFRVGSEPCCGSISLALMASVPPPLVTTGSAAEDATQEVVQDVVCHGDGGRALPA